MRLNIRVGGEAAMIVVLAVALQPGVQALPEPDDRWLQVETEQFVLFGDVGESQCRTLALQLERLRHVLGGIAPAMRLGSAPPVFVYVFGEDRSFRSYARKQGVPGGVGGLSFSGDGGDFIMVNAGGEASSFGVVYHEYLHHAMSRSFPDLPLWLNEGMAEFFSTFWTNGYQAEIGVPVAEHLDRLVAGPVMPLERLFAVTPRSPEYSDVNAKTLFHAQSWLLTHYLLQGRPELRISIPRYLQALRQGPVELEALESIFGVGVEQLESDLRSYVERGVFRNSTIDFAVPLPEADVAVETMPDSEVHYRLGLLLAHGRPDGLGMAERHLTRALKLDPDHAACLAALADLRARRGKTPKP
jgi:hypothetical protein